MIEKPCKLTFFALDLHYLYIRQAALDLHYLYIRQAALGKISK